MCNPSSCRSQKSINPGGEQGGYVESGHILEQTEYALAVAVGSGDQTRIQELRTRIEALGDYREEPGTWRFGFAFVADIC